MLALAAVPPEPQLDAALAPIATDLAGTLEAETVEPTAVEAAGILLERAATAARRAGARTLVLTADPATSEHERLAAAAEMHLDRELLQLRRSLPLDVHSSVAVRAFRPSQDDAAWLEVNNRAFAWHPDQSNWSEDDLRRKIAEPWFDAEGFLLHEVEGRLAGFCWTKIHRDVSPALGEIFVIAVDPYFHGRGLGKQLTLAGLDWLAARGLQNAMLYVEADNTPARSLYERLGFVAHHAKRWWTRELT